VSEFSKKDQNYRKATIFKKPLVTRGRQDAGLLDKNLFGRDTPYEILCKLAKLKYEDFFGRGGAKS